jgi:serine/threonine protein kinase
VAAGAGYEGRVLAGRYRVEALIGSGGMGAVYRASDTRLARQVAVKLVAAESLGDEAARERLIREALACAALHHPGIVHVYDVGETDDGGAFLVMELVTGTPLRALVHDDSWTDTARLTAIVEAARALAAAHRAGIVHRDVKPDNLMLRDDGRVALLDFGIAKQATGQELTTNLTGTGVVVGTPAYLSPEQARGRALDARTDQFSLAVTAYELLTRNIPWTATSAIAVVAAIMNDPTPPLRLADAGLARAVGPVLERATHKKPEDRYPDLDAFADALSQSAGIAPPPSGLPVSIPQPPRSGGPEAFAATALVESTPNAHARAVSVPSSPAVTARARGWRKSWSIAAVVALALGTASGAGIWRHLRNPLDTPHAVVAFPMLEGYVDGQPAPWLGAAAAYLLADDLAPMLGGFDDHVRDPAALLQIPGYAPDARELDPWKAQGLRERAIGAATSAGSAWLDGRIEVRGAQASIEVTLRTATGRVLGSASATGKPLRRLVLDVSRKLRAAGALGRDHALEPEFRQWRGVSSVDEQDATMDVEAAVFGEPGRGACGASLPAHLPVAWTQAIADGCADKPLPADVPAPLLTMWDATSPSLAAPELRERLRRDVAAAPPGARKAMLLAMSLKLEETSAEGISSAVLAAVAVDPRRGWSGVPHGLVTADPVMVSNALAWAPDSADWWLTATRALPATGQAHASDLYQREFILIPYGTSASLYADSLLREGNASGLGAVVAHLKGSDDDEQRALGRLLAARAAVLDGAFARTLAQWTEELSKPEALFGDTPDDSMRISSARELAFAMSAERDLGNVEARAIVGGGVATRLSEDNVTIRPNLAASCALAEPGLAAKCLAALAPPAGTPALEQEDWRVMREVVDRYAARDFPRAAAAARRLMGSQYYPYYVVRFGDLLVDVFDRGGVPGLAEGLDSPHVDDRNLHGTSLAALRTARRARTRGDQGRARVLAQRIIDAWKLVDTSVPAVDEMQALLDPNVALPVK